MKKFTVFLCAAVLILSFTGIASASLIPFEISGGSMDIVWNGPNGPDLPRVGENPVYTPQASSFWLGQGDSEIVTFGTVDTTPTLFGSGTVTFGVEFSMPDLDGVVRDDARFWVLSFSIFSLDLTFGNLDFPDDPVMVSYSYDGAPGGLMAVDFFDQGRFQLGHSVDIRGRVTNVTNPVPEPTTMLLLGTGLIGLAGIGRKNFFKKR